VRTSSNLNIVKFFHHRETELNFQQNSYSISTHTLNKLLQYLVKRKIVANYARKVLTNLDKNFAIFFIDFQQEHVVY